MNAANAGESLRVLLVDDDQDQYVLTRDMLDHDSLWHCDLDWAADFDAGVRSFRNGAYDVALVDYRLGERHGIDLLRTDAVRNAGIPAVMLTGDSDARVDMDALAAGAVDYLVKSEVTAATLKRTLRHAVERHRAVTRLRQQEAEYRSTFDDAPIGIAHTDLSGRWIRANHRLQAMLGCTSEQLAGTDCTAFSHPDNQAAHIAARQQLLSGAISQHASEQQCRRASGGYFWANVTLSLHRGERGEPKYFIAIVEDISERKRAEQELDHIFNLSPDMICTSDFEGAFTRVNASFSTVLGYSAAELQARPILSLVHPDDRAPTIAALSKLAEGQTVFGFTNRYRAADGSYRSIEWHSKADVARRVIYAVARDQTDRMEMAQQLHQAQKMEAVGRLAGGVAHDFNNLLTAIIGFSEMTIAQLAPDDPRRDDVEQILQAGQSAASLTRQLLAFSRKQILEPKVLDVNALVGGLQSLLRRVIGEDIEMVIALGEPAGRVNADRGQLEQVLMNLAVNARDAMPTGGTLHVSTDIVELDETFLATHPGARAGQHVRLTLTDTGHGMTPEVMRQLFEPFFTTKERGKGTGLGLATVYGIVKQSGGYIGVESAPGRGTAFTIHFPRVLDEPARAEPAAEREADLRGSETILLVEDQQEVRQAVAQALLRRGYQVLDASGGVEALALLAGHPGRVHLLLTDVVMPRMSGRELAGRVAAHDPTIRVLYASGYADDAIGPHGVFEPGTDFIHKPFTPDQLVARVRDVLDRRDRGAL